MSRPTYLRGSISCYLDRCRGYLVNATPEEAVRQDTLDWLIDEMNVPKTRVRSEFNQRKRGADGRADIIVLGPGASDHEGNALMVVECKRPGVFLDDRVKEQAIRYAIPLGAQIVVVTNGSDRWAFKPRQGEWARLQTIPNWNALLESESTEWAPEEEFVRWAYEDISDTSSALKVIDEQRLRDWLFGADSADTLAAFALNLMGFLADAHTSPSVPFRSGDIVIEKDLGQRSRGFGNHAGGVWASNYYRSFLVFDEQRRSYEVVSLTVAANAKVTGHPRWGNRRGRTMLVVAVDEGTTSHVSLEMGLDEAFDPAEASRTVTIQHSGALTAGKRGALPRRFVLEQLALYGAPDLVSAGAVALGELPRSRELTWKNSQKFVGNVIRYALARDRIRAVSRGSL